MPPMKFRRYGHPGDVFTSSEDTTLSHPLTSLLCHILSHQESMLRVACASYFLIVLIVFSCI